MAESTETIPTSQMIDKFMGAAHTALLCDILGALIEKDVLNQGYVVARLERLSKELGAQAGARYAVPIVDIVRDYVAGEQRRALS